MNMRRHNQIVDSMNKEAAAKSGLTALPIPAGKKLSKPQTNLLIKMDKLCVPAPATPEPRKNPYSGAIHTLSPLGCALYDFIVESRGTRMGPLSYKGNKVNVAEWDRARYLFLELYPDEYYSLID